MALTHSVFYISNSEDKVAAIEGIIGGGVFSEVAQRKGFLFSAQTIDAYIKDELLHDAYPVIKGLKNSFQKYSDGEKKKILLAHVLSQKLDYIVFDNLFDYLDTPSRGDVYNVVRQLSESTIILQIISRKSEAMPFIDRFYSFKDGKFILEDNATFFETLTTVRFSGVIPLPFQSIAFQGEPLVALNNVNVSYEGRPILKDITWHIGKGEFWQLVGPNGAGKSTILSLITGDNAKAYGQDITLFGYKKGHGESVWDIRKHIGYFSSGVSRGFYRLDSVRDMIISGFVDSIGLYKAPAQSQTRLAQEWIDLLGLSNVAHTPFIQLSKGSQKLVLIARAMVKHPDLLILDEPTSDLDDEATALFVGLVNKIAEETRTAILYVSHKREEGLKPSHIFLLTHHHEGSLGEVVNVD